MKLNSREIRFEKPTENMLLVSVDRTLHVLNERDIKTNFQLINESIVLVNRLSMKGQALKIDFTKDVVIVGSKILNTASRFVQALKELYGVITPQDEFFSDLISGDWRAISLRRLTPDAEVCLQVSISGMNHTTAPPLLVGFESSLPNSPIDRQAIEAYWAQHGSSAAVTIDAYIDQATGEYYYNDDIPNSYETRVASIMNADGEFQQHNNRIKAFGHTHTSNFAYNLTEPFTFNQSLVVWNFGRTLRQNLSLGFSNSDGIYNGSASEDGAWTFNGGRTNQDIENIEDINLNVTRRANSVNNGSSVHFWQIQPSDAPYQLTNFSTPAGQIDSENKSGQWETMYFENEQPLMTVIQNNVNDYYGIWSTEHFSETIDGAYLGLSLRRLSSAATNCVRVRRASDDAEQDFGFVSNGISSDLDIEAIETFCEGGDGFIQTWYDQGTESNNATQDNPLFQPKLVEDGSVVMSGGRAIMVNDETTYLTLDQASPVYNDSFSVVDFNGRWGTNFLFNGFQIASATQRHGFWLGEERFAAGGTIPEERCLLSLSHNHYLINAVGPNILEDTTPNTPVSTDLIFGTLPGNTKSMANCSEVIICANKQDEQKVQKHINQYFKIY